MEPDASADTAPKLDQGDAVHQLIIIGSGPAGYTAAIYAARANLQPLLLASSVEAGGELMNTTTVENFPGFPEGIEGPELMSRLRTQAERFGTTVRLDDVVALDLTGSTCRVLLGDGTTHESLALIYATGSAPRKLGVSGEARLSGYGVSYCATCDGFFFRDKVIAIVGGGDSAMEEALFLTKFARKVLVIHRRQELRASKVMQDRAKANPKIEFVLGAEVVEILGDRTVTGVTIRNLQSAETWHAALSGVFVAVGNDPRVHLIHGQLDLSSEGTVRVNGRSSRTSKPGVFAAGDVVDPTYRQAVTASASGTVAALDVEHYLSQLNDDLLTKAALREPASR